MTKPKTPAYTFDTTLRPQDDFYGYVNNTWLAAHPIPESETRWGAFMELRDEAWHNMRDIYEKLQSEEPAKGSVRQQARDFYYTGMHLDDFVDTHMQLIHALFEDIEAIATPRDLSRVLGSLHAMKINGPWVMIIDADNDDSSKHVVRFRQAGLTLPDRDYYLEETEKMRRIRDEYRLHMDKVYDFFPSLSTSAKELWATVYSFERALAEVSRSSTDLRDVQNNYHKTALAAARKTYSHIDWQAYATELGWEADDKLSIDHPEFMAYVDAQLTARSLTDWKTYLKWRVVVACYGKVSTELASLRFEFFGKVLSGTTKMMPLWKRIVLAADDAIGEAVGQLYAEHHFPESSKRQMLSLVDATRATYEERIKRLEWMSEETKTYALKKLANMKVLIGYPDTWRDYTDLAIDRTSYLGNYIAAARFDNAYWLRRLHEPTSREEWYMNPQTVNAYHDPNRLVICFPAAILQPPFFDPVAHIAANMGGIGVVIGHELTHGFDDQGCMFDAEGNVRTWQTPSERKTFKQKAKIIIDQADHFEVLPGLTLKGGLIIGESIADLGGLEIAFETLSDQLKGQLNDTVDDNLTAEELFYVNYARTECMNVREEKLREYTLTDPHPASVFRVNGMVQHNDDFYRIFAVARADNLYLPPDKRARIW